jgi:hypothetical protein
MAKGLFGSLKGVDAFGKVCHVATLGSYILMTIPQTTEDVKVKTRTGAFCRIQQRQAFQLLMLNVLLILSDFAFGCNHTGIHYNGVLGLPADHDRYVYSRGQE